MSVRLFMGGTFDPVHYGHLRIADRLRVALDLPDLALIPTAHPPHKPRESMTPIQHRVAMVRLALEEFPGLSVCELELIDAVSYTVDTLRSLRRRESGLQPVFVVGMDAVAELSTWHEYRALLEEFDLIAIARPDHDRSTIADCDPFVARRIRPVVEPEGAIGLIANEDLGKGGRIFPVRLAPESISSRQVRQLSATGASLDALVPADVALYIQRHQLYERSHR